MLTIPCIIIVCTWTSKLIVIIYEYYVAVNIVKFCYLYKLCFWRRKFGKWLIIIKLMEIVQFWEI